MFIIWYVYNTHKISTIVDIQKTSSSSDVYNTHKISTIVDCANNRYNVECL